jgi:hypothetical protein
MRDMNKESSKRSVKLMRAAIASVKAGTYDNTNNTANDATSSTSSSTYVDNDTPISSSSSTSINKRHSNVSRIQQLIDVSSLNEETKE